MKLKQCELYIRSMGKLLRVEAVFGVSPDEISDANNLMGREGALAVVAECDGMIFLANKHDRGIKAEFP